ncbi:MAG: glycoside hydrolase family 38 C-terminal domain-containing protein [Rhodobacter sp.]|nr:glycoside hydrolase family 38 C-terminal domain-containing protein [Rhodobacter sp.]
MNHELRFTAPKIAARLDLIRQMVVRRRLDLPPFRLCQLSDAAEAPPFEADMSAWPEIEPESYWGHADLNFLMTASFNVPDGWDASRIALHLPLGTFGDIFNHPEALVLIDGTPIGSADRYHHTLALDPVLADGRGHRLDLHGWTGHTQWPPDPASRAKLFMGRPALVERDPALRDFIGLAEAALDTCGELDRASVERSNLLDALDAAFLVLDTRAPLGEALYESVPSALTALQGGIAAAGEPLDVTLHGIGHAHIDIAYLWPIDQTRHKIARTYSNVLRLMEADPDYRFSHSQPQLYACCERDHPAIFAKIRDRVAEGRWEVMGGMWVEPDLNIAGPEALVRQLVLGRRYFRDTFGDVETPVLWLPDTFGFPGQIPQLMAQAGLNWFCTNKLNWNQVTRVPPTHHWEGIDGTRVPAHVLTTPREVQYLPFPTNYKSDLSAKEVAGTVDGADADARNLPICYGYGDGGGGPTEALLARARAYSAMPGMPGMRFSSVRAAFEAIEAEGRALPVHRGEHYMEGHRGVLTSQAWIKRANRLNERALHEAEALSVIAGLCPDLDEAWRLLCLNQFHDIVTGTSVPQVFDDARRDHARIARQAENVSARASDALATGAAEAVVLNTAPVPADRIAEIQPELAAGLPGQRVAGRMLVYLPELPPYSLTPISDAVAPPQEGLSVRLTGTGARMENRFVRVCVDQAGRVTSVWDKGSGTECLADGEFGNRFQAFEDRPICWDAWDIDPSFEDRMDPIAETAGLSIVEAGPIRASIRVEFTWRQSRFRQDIHLAAHSPRIDFATEIDWHQTHTLLKVAFPVAVKSDHALYDIQWGAIARPTTRDTPADFARFEVAAQKWALLSDGVRGVALLNDCKYGHDIAGNVMRLTLIKSSTMPDPAADQGHHRFTYAILPFQGSDRSIVDAAAYDMNTPLRAIPPRPAQAPTARLTPLVSIRRKRAIPESIVPLNGSGFLVRLFEPDGESGEVHIAFGPRVAQVWRSNLLADPLDRLDVHDNAVFLPIRPFEIVTLRISAAESERDPP